MNEQEEREELLRMARTSMLGLPSKRVTIGDMVRSSWRRRALHVVFAALFLFIAFCAGRATAQQLINLGSGPNTGTGDTALTAFGKVNANTTTLWNNQTTLLGRTNLTNLRDYGAKGDALSYADGVISSGSNAFSSATATFTSADVGKTIQIDGAGSGIYSAPLVTTIASFIDAHDITLAATASTTTPLSYLFYVSAVPTPETAGNYQPGDVMSLVGGTSTVTAQVTVTTTEFVSATVNNAGASGTNGACILIGTTGTGSKFRVNATITGNAISAIGSIIDPGHYLTNPTITGEPVTSSCGLVGATLNLVLGVDKVSISNRGNYTVTPSNPVATTAGSLSGATGATLTVTTWQPTGAFIYATDDGAALASAITAAIAAGNAGKNTAVYAPAGAYYIGNTAIPTFFGANQSGGIIGDGHALTQFIVGANHIGDLFSWSEAWGASKRTPSIDRFSPDTGARVVGFSVLGDLLAGGQQNAIMFYDREDFALIDDIYVVNLNGRCFLSGALKNQIQSWMRESSIRRFTCFNAGQTGVPPFELNSQGGGDGTNEIEIGELNIFAPYDSGFVIRNNGTGGIRGVRIKHIRVEGVQPGIWPLVAGNLIQIGDAVQTGQVNSITFEVVEAISPYPGYADFLVAGQIATEPYQISVESGIFGGGSPSGKGLNIQSGRSLYFHLTGISSQDTNVTIAANTQTGGPILIDLNRALDWTGVTTNIDSTEVNNVYRPIYQNGYWTTEVPGGNVLPFSFNAVANAGSPILTMQTNTGGYTGPYTGGLGVVSGVGQLTLKGIPVAINGSSGTNATNIGTGSTTGTVTIGNSSNSVVMAGAPIQLNVGLNNSTSLNTSTSTGGVNIGGGSNTLTFNGSSIIETGAPIQLNVGANNNTSINTSTSTGTVNIGGGSATVVMNAATSINVNNNQGTSIGTGSTTSNVAIGGGSNGLISVTGPFNVNANQNSAINLGTGTDTQTVTIGGGANTVALNGSTVTVTGPLNINTNQNNSINLDVGTSTGTVTIGGGSGQFTVADPTSINVNQNFTTGINTGTSTGGVNLGGGSGTVTVNDAVNMNVSQNHVTNINTGTTTSAVNIANGSGNAAVSIGNGTGKVTIQGPLITAAGTQFTVASGTGACGTTSTLVGGVQAGDLTCTAATAASTVTLTLVATTTAYTCWGRDITTPTTVTQTGAKSTTSVTLTFTSVTQNDVVQFGCLGY